VNVEDASIATDSALRIVGRSAGGQFHERADNQNNR